MERCFVKFIARSLGENRRREPTNPTPLASSNPAPRDVQMLPAVKLS